MSNGKFVVKKVVTFEELMSGKLKEIPESDLCFQSEHGVIQFEHKPDEDYQEKVVIKPGRYSLQMTSAGIVPMKIELRERQLLEDVSSTKAILKEARTFFQRLHVYERLGRPKKRGVLVYSAPGLGKSSSIEKFCLDFSKEDPGTVVLLWPTSKVEADAILTFLNSGSEYAPECTRVILVMEDIGGGEPGEYNRASRSVDSGMLNLLDGIGLTFRLPTFIVATTNHPESLLESLADRPGRFDLMLELKPPTHDEKIRLLSFIAKRELSDEEKECLGWKGTEDFSVAHLEEIAIRSELHDKSYSQVVEELVEHSKRFKKAFVADTGGLGFGL